MFKKNFIKSKNMTLNMYKKHVTLRKAAAVQDPASLLLEMLLRSARGTFVLIALV